MPGRLAALMFLLVAAGDEETVLFALRGVLALDLRCKLPPQEVPQLIDWAIAEDLVSSLSLAEALARLESFPDAVRDAPREVAPIVNPLILPSPNTCTSAASFVANELSMAQSDACHTCAAVTWFTTVMTSCHGRARHFSSAHSTGIVCCRCRSSCGRFSGTCRRPASRLLWT